MWVGGEEGVVKPVAERVGSGAGERGGEGSRNGAVGLERGEEREGGAVGVGEGREGGGETRVEECGQGVDARAGFGDGLPP
jgi:hypothetical protein